RKGTNRDLRAGLGRPFPLPAARGGVSYRGQQSVDGRRAGRQEALPDGGIEGQMAVLLQRGEEAGQHRLEALVADPIGGFPQDDEGFAHRLTVDLSSNRGTAWYGRTGDSQEPDGMLAMTPG